MDFKQMRQINVNEFTEKKDGLTYLSWAWAWDTFKQAYPDAVYTIAKDENQMPYFANQAGAMCYTSVTAGGITHEMWLPVMNGANKAMKSEPYTYHVKDWKTKQMVEKTVEGFTMFDVNKTLMRCLVKNLAMFGLGLYIYAGEDIPEMPEPEPIDVTQYITAIIAVNNIDELKEVYVNAIKACAHDDAAKKRIGEAKDAKKIELTTNE